MNDRQRISYLSELLKLPTASISYNDDDESGAAPSGFTIRVAASCLPEVKAHAQTFRDAVDKFKEAADKGQAVADGRAACDADGFEEREFIRTQT